MDNKLACIENNHGTVALAEEYVKQRGDHNPTALTTGRRGIIEQLKSAVETTEEVGEFYTIVYFMAVKEHLTEDGKRMHLQILRATMLFNTIGGFEFNLVRYGIK